MSRKESRRWWSECSRLHRFHPDEPSLVFSCPRQRPHTALSYPHVDVAHAHPRPASPPVSTVPRARLGRPAPYPLPERRLQAGRPRGQQHRRRQEWLPQDEDDELRSRKGIQTQRCAFFSLLSSLVLSLQEGGVVQARAGRWTGGEIVAPKREHGPALQLLDPPQTLSSRMASQDALLECSKD